MTNNTITTSTTVAPATVTKADIQKMTPEQAIVKFGNGNKSACIRALTAMGTFTTSEIAKVMNIRYQFVRNVQKEPVRKGK